MPRKMRPLIESSEIGNLDPEMIRAVVRAVHVVPLSTGWEVRKSGKDRVSEIFVSKPLAEKFARELSEHENVEVILHKRPRRKLQKKDSFAKSEIGRN